MAVSRPPASRTAGLAVAQRKKMNGLLFVGILKFGRTVLFLNKNNPPDAVNVAEIPRCGNFEYANS